MEEDLQWKSTYIIGVGRGKDKDKNAYEPTVCTPSAVWPFFGSDIFLDTKYSTYTLILACTKIKVKTFTWDLIVALLSPTCVFVFLIFNFIFFICMFLPNDFVSSVSLT